MGGEAQPTVGKQRKRLLHGVNCIEGPTPLPLEWGLCCRGAGCFLCSHPTAIEVLT